MDICRVNKLDFDLQILPINLQSGFIMHEGLVLAQYDRHNSKVYLDKNGVDFFNMKSGCDLAQRITFEAELVKILGEKFTAIPCMHFTCGGYREDGL